MPGFEIQSHCSNMLNANIAHFNYSCNLFDGTIESILKLLNFSYIGIALYRATVANYSYFDTKNFIEVSDCTATNFRKFVKVSYFCNR